VVNCVVMKHNTINHEQLNKIIEFRQRVYACLEQGKDSQFQLVDALLGDMRVGSYAELSLSPQFERGWGSAYDGIENGTLQREKLRQLFIEQLPADEVVVCPLDTTVWPHPAARTLEGLMFEISPTTAAKKQTAVVGHVYSLLGWSRERGSSWCLGLDNERLTMATDAITLGVKQVQQLVQRRQAAGATGLTVVPADGKYGTHLFLAPLREQAQLALVTRLRCDRVLYGPPPAYAGSGRPRKHGQRFAFKDDATWHTAEEDVTFADERWGQVRLRGWHDLHMKQAADTPFTAIHVQTHLEREKPPQPIWLGYQGPQGYSVKEAWLWFDQRWPIEPSIRFRKQKLHLCLPKLQTADRCDRWWWLVETAFWQLHLARPLVQDQPLPWQKPQATLTPSRTLRAFASLFAQIGSPTRPLQSRQNGQGWPKGRPRTRPTRFKPQRRHKDRRKKKA
jgi:hypothetical protein